MGDKGDKGGSTFRQRRLSLGEISQEEFDKSSINNDSPAGGRPGRSRRQRRVSMSPEMGVVKPQALLPFPPDIVGTYSCHGVEPGMKQGETHAKINQDRGCICFPFGPEVPGESMALFCVFDGHGSCGDKVSHFSMNKLQTTLEDHPLLPTDPETALKETFVSVDDELRKESTIDAELSGTTAVVLLAKWQSCNPTKATLYIANAGDSRAVLAKKTASGYKSEDMSIDQKPDSPLEMDRIKKNGGFVSPPEEEWGGPARVWLDASQTLPGLAMARSIGDHLVSSVGVIAKPEVIRKEVDTGGGDAFFVMASDGVWEFIESQDAVAIVSAQIDSSATEACTRLIETAAAKWRQEEGDYRDDITAICVRLPDILKKDASVDG